MIDTEEASALLHEAEHRDKLEHSPLVERLAVLGSFDPRKLGDDDAPDVADLLCETLPSHHAILRERPRVDALVRMLQRGGTAEFARVRQSTEAHLDSPLQRMLDAFVLGDGPALEQRDEDELLASLSVTRWVSEAMAHAGQIPRTPIAPGRDAIESRLALLDVTRAIRRLATGGCVGRDAELARLHEYCRSRPESSDFEAEPAMVVYGIGGVGKSTLVARFAMDLYQARNDAETGVWAYLDLDRPTLASCDAGVLLDDIVRQVAAQRPEERRQLLRSEEISRRRMKGAGLEAVDSAGSYRETGSGFINVMRGVADGALVVVLDTYEQLERNQPSRASELWDLFALLAARLPRFRLIVSGRTPASVYVKPNRPDRQLHVVGLDNDNALALLRHFVRIEAEKANRPEPVVPDDLGHEVIELVGGIPLTVRLAARVLVEEGPGAIADAADRAHTLDRVRSEFVRGFLYQRILDHISAGPPVDTGDLRRLARASIALRRITVEHVEHVLAPALLPRPASDAADLFDALSSEVAFIEADGGELRLREELRVPALAALQIDDHALVRRVHENAVAFYSALRPDAAAELEFAYHRLALGASPAEFDEAILRQLEPAVDDLPPASAARVREAVEDPAALDAAQDLESWERRVAPLVDSALRDGRLDEAAAMLAERVERSPSSMLYRLQSRLAQARGDLSEAQGAAGLDLGAAELAADPTRLAAAVVRLAGLHEVGGDASAADRVLQYGYESELLTGSPELRLELLLNRTNSRERTGIEDEHAHWRHSLEARALMQRIDPRELAANSALVRLMAAALGREEPDRIREAVKLVGLGHLEDAVRVQKMITAIADWDASLPEPGRLAKRYMRLDGDGPEAILRAWTPLAGLGTDTGLVLDRLWREEAPPDDVREAVREIYLWWAVDTPRAAQPESAERRGHFLDDVPVDWSRPQVRALEELMLTAYPTGTDSMVIAAKAGLDLQLISWASTGRRITRELLASASRTGRLPELVGTVLADADAVSIHGPLRALVGDAWLSAHHL